MRFRIRFAQLGGHVHVRFFQKPSHTWQKCGDLIFDKHAWPHALDAFRRGDIQILSEGDIDPEAV